MSAAFKAVAGLFGILPGWVWAAVVAGLVGHSCGQGLKIEAGKLAVSDQKVLVKKAELKLSDRIAAEAVTVASAVQVARLEERAKTKLVQEKTNVLRKENDVARADLADAAGRLRVLSDEAAAGFGCRDMRPGGAATGGVDDDPVARFQAAGRIFNQGLLQLLSESDEVTRERNLCIAIRPADK